MARFVLSFHVEGHQNIQRHVEALVLLQLSALPHVHSVRVKADVSPDAQSCLPAMSIAA